MDTMTTWALICAAFFLAGFGSAVILFALLRERLIGNAQDAHLREVYGPTLRRAQQHALRQPAAIDLSGFELRPRHERRR